MEERSQVSRRAFLRELGAGSATVGALLAGCGPSAAAVRWQTLDVTEIPEGKPTKAKAGPAALVVVRQGDRIYALDDTCSHEGCSLSGGYLVDDGARIQCPCHGSRFDLADGSVMRAPAIYPQPAFEVRRANGRFEVTPRLVPGRRRSR